MKKLLIVVMVALCFSACEKENNTKSDLVEIEVYSKWGDYAVEYTKKGQKINVEMVSGSTYKDEYLLGDDEYIYVEANSTEQFSASTELTIIFYYEGKLVKDTTANTSVWLIIDTENL